MFARKRIVSALVAGLASLAFLTTSVRGDEPGATEPGTTNLQERRAHGR